MVLVIVSRNIDLSVGSLVGLIAMSYALLMTDIMPNVLGIGADFPFRWLIVLGIGIAMGAAVGGLQGFIIAYIGVPSFIVTLGGLLSIRGAVWYLSNGAAVSGLDPNFQLIGGGAQGSIGGTLTWVLGLVGVVAIIVLLINGRRQRRRYGFPLRPMWAEVLIGVVGSVAVLGLAAFANANLWPEGLANRIALEQNWGPAPEGGWRIPTGFPNPIVLLLGVTLVMTFIATRRRFGRYVYAYGGNPDAAELAGINTRWTILKTYVLMGILCALAAAIASARLNGSTLDVGQSYELYVIAAAVVGGTSFAGGIGTIPGAVLGAFVMQSLAYGLSFMGVNSPGQNVVAGHRADRRRRPRHLQPPARRLVNGKEERPVTVAERTPLVEMRDISVAFGGVHAVRDVTIDLIRRRGHRPRRRQRRRQVDAHARPLGRPSRRHRRDPGQRRAGGHPQPA